MTEKPWLPTILSVMAGYVDTAGFLALHGLFTAHVTGNFVTIGAALVSGTSGVIAKLLALPVFCLFVIGSRLLRYRLMDRGLSVVRSLLAIKLALLVAAMILALRYGPFPHVDSWSSTLTGMILVGAMAIQNALHRVHLGSSPPSTLMTGTTTQMMLDIGDRLCGAPSDQREVINSRLKKMGVAVLAFAVGCAGGALCYAFGGMWCFVVPPVLATAALLRHGDATA
ncbi:YoaK family protein [Dyella japonica]|uniref:Membrane protein n=1 Tax=Dyella japonica A8 TaxID=1217721 RepID=A0A075K336_9GAMM|nr:YoaK family protein [Dyella japonica]AIF48092.1 membrane protein [Dyella japonica A8]